MNIDTAIGEDPILSVDVTNAGIRGDDAFQTFGGRYSGHVLSQLCCVDPNSVRDPEPNIFDSSDMQADSHHRLCRQETNPFLYCIFRIIATSLRRNLDIWLSDLATLLPTKKHRPKP